MSPVKQLRIEKGISRQELANRVLITPRHLGRVESGEYKAIRLLARLAKELGVPVEKLVG
ncbi:anaerobic benzoate catabolism transcriptional regulator [Pelotomaculum schinkii]|uniref:Anaerobic benzoate catabolism transcriptional regulator n=1 Tax=Pelotomaculum schinkii TaxID=78350 RepID=A0A4Y7RI01_9FIRM|nr:MULTISPECIES: helix-turn-helix transcriptional regulator [Pelotomaculum]TEB08614.1 anaerobic benzoate catabolism transcriptional regulator [Pelotomaculum schinkii]TEB16809.1 anaerobic benzoate catabolism transcriptional regulator [Pelotomaculum sp. FP]